MPDAAVLGRARPQLKPIRMSPEAVPLRFGAFIAPYHRPDGRIADAFERDLQLVERLEDLGFDEAWFGEHHSGGWETITCPELMIAAAAQRTVRIRLGTGVVSLPYHHPLTTADRLLMLDQLSRGRLMIGLGSGALDADLRMMGADPAERSAMFAERLDAVLPLLRGTSPATAAGRDFRLVDGRTQFRGYAGRVPPVYLASSFAGTGLRLAARHGTGLLLLGIGHRVAGAFRDAAAAVEAEGRPLDRRRILLILNAHVAESRRAAIEAIREAAEAEQYEYWNAVVGMPAPDYPRHEHVERMIERGSLLAGSPGEIVDGLRALLAATGPVGGVLLAAREWAGPVGTDRNWELFAREVVPALRTGSDAHADPAREGTVPALP